MRTAVLVLLLSSIACQREPAPPLDHSEEHADQISGVDDPSGSLYGARRKLSDLVTTDDVGETFSVPDSRVPYPDTYWPMQAGGIDAQWLEISGKRCVGRCERPDLSPLEKYMSLSDPRAMAKAKEWENKNHGREFANLKQWNGHCPGWSGSAMSGPPIKSPVLARWNEKRGFEACDDAFPEDNEDCVQFEIGDINALQAEIYVKGGERLIGSKCGKPLDEIERDEFGRVLDPGCRGLNAGSMLIVLGNRIKRERMPFAVDIQKKTTTAHIWNQPVYAYTINRFEPLSEQQAANLVASGQRTGPMAEYEFNKTAKGFALVDWTLSWVTEKGPNLEVLSGLDSTKTTRMVAVIELDAAADDPTAAVIGGEYIEDGTKGASRLDVAPFAWIVLSPGSDLFDHNPYVKSAEVLQLVALGRGETPTPLPAPPGTCEHDLCEQGEPLEVGCDDGCVEVVCDEAPSCCQSGWSLACIGLAEDSCDEFCF